MHYDYNRLPFKYEYNFFSAHFHLSTNYIKLNNVNYFYEQIYSWEGRLLLNYSYLIISISKNQFN